MIATRASAAPQWSQAIDLDEVRRKRERLCAHNPLGDPDKQHAANEGADRLAVCPHGWRPGGAAACPVCSGPRQGDISRYRPRSATSTCGSCGHYGPMSSRAICETCGADGPAHVGRYRTWCCECAAGHKRSYPPDDAPRRTPQSSQRRTFKRLQLGDRTLPWPAFRGEPSDLSLFQFVAPRETGFIYSATPGQENGLTVPSPEWSAEIHSASRKRYRDNGIERYFRPLENRLRREPVDVVTTRCAVTNELFRPGKRGPATTISPKGADRVRKQRERSEKEIDKRLAIPMPKTRRGDETFERCLCCLLWIDFDAVRRQLDDWLGGQRSREFHLMRGRHGENELLRLPSETAPTFADQSYESRTSTRDDPLGFREFASPGDLDYEGVAISDSGIAYALSLDQRKAQRTRKGRRRPPRLTEDNWQAVVVEGAVVDGEPAPISKLRDAALISESTYGDSALETEVSDAGTFQLEDLRELPIFDSFSS